MKCDDCFGFQRARTPEQVAQRRESILAAMSELLETELAENITLSQVARKAGLAKSNVYRYFTSREAILLEMVRTDGLVWIDDIERELTPLHDSNDCHEIAVRLARVTAAQPRMCHLIGLVPSVLERNISVDEARDFKQHTYTLFGRIGRQLRKSMPSTPREAIDMNLHLITALIAGIWPQSKPAAVVRTVISERDDWGVMLVNFEESFCRALHLLLEGIQASSEKPQP